MISVIVQTAEGSLDGTSPVPDRSLQGLHLWTAPECMLLLCLVLVSLVSIHGVMGRVNPTFLCGGPTLILLPIVTST